MATELKEVECLWVKHIQRSMFTEENRQLLAGDTVIYKGQLILMSNDQHLMGHLNQLITQKKPYCFPLNIDF